MKTCATMLVFMAAGLATCEAVGFLGWFFGTYNEPKTVSRPRPYQSDRLKRDEVPRQVYTPEEIKRSIDKMIDSSYKMKRLVASYTRMGLRDRPIELAVHLLIYDLGQVQTYETKNYYGYWEVDSRKFNEALNTNLVPYCKELMDQINKLSLSSMDMTEIRDEKVRNVVSLEKTCQKALGWTSSDTFQLQEEITRAARRAADANRRALNQSPFYRS